MQLTDRELDIMAALWHEGPSTAAEVRECLRRDGVDLAHNTVLTILRILENKGHVDHSAEGHTHRFHPLVEQHAVGVSALTQTVDHLFDSSAEAPVSSLMKEQTLSRDGIERLHGILDEQFGTGRDI
ncbi:MAG: BlaI/MecI/CopY family transcriptional regulator [Gemmatimonadaceae bacterium]